MTDQHSPAESTGGDAPETHLPLDRRDFVKGGLIAGGLLAAPGVGSAASALEAGSADGSPDLNFVEGSTLDANLFYSDGIRGDSTVIRREDSSDVFAFDWLTTAQTRRAPPGGSTDPTDAGRMLVETPVDTSTTLLYQFMMRGQALSDVELRLYRPDPDTGDIMHYYTIELRNVTIESIRLNGQGGPAFLRSGTGVHRAVLALAPETVAVKHETESQEFQFTL